MKEAEIDSDDSSSDFSSLDGLDIVCSKREKQLDHDQQDEDLLDDALFSDTADDQPALDQPAIARPAIARPLQGTCIHVHIMP